MKKKPCKSLVNSVASPSEVNWTEATSDRKQHRPMPSKYAYLHRYVNVQLFLLWITLTGKLYPTGLLTIRSIMYQKLRWNIQKSKLKRIKIILGTLLAEEARLSSASSPTTCCRDVTLLIITTIGVWTRIVRINDPCVCEKIEERKCFGSNCN